MFSASLTGSDATQHDVKNQAPDRGSILGQMLRDRGVQDMPIAVECARNGVPRPLRRQLGRPALAPRCGTGILYLFDAP